MQYIDLLVYDFLRDIKNSIVEFWFNHQNGTMEVVVSIEGAVLQVFINENEENQLRVFAFEQDPLPLNQVNFLTALLHSKIHFYDPK